MEADEIFRKMVDGYVLLANDKEALLANNPSWHPEPPDALTHFMKLSAGNVVRAGRSVLEKSVELK